MIKRILYWLDIRAWIQTLMMAWELGFEEAHRRLDVQEREIERRIAKHLEVLRRLEQRKQELQECRDSQITWDEEGFG